MASSSNRGGSATSTPVSSSGTAPDPVPASAWSVVTPESLPRGRARRTAPSDRGRRRPRRRHAGAARSRPRTTGSACAVSAAASSTMRASLRCSRMRNPGSNARSSIRWPWTSRIFEPANPPSSASRTFAASTPGAFGEQQGLGDGLDRGRDDELVARLAHLARAARSDVHDVLARAPRGAGSLARTPRSSPPTMIESVASIAPFSPARDRGVEHRDVPRGERRGHRARRARGRSSSCRSRGSPPATPSITPPRPTRTCSTSAVSGSIVIVTSLAAATSAGSSPAPRRPPPARRPAPGCASAR